MHTQFFFEFLQPFPTSTVLVRTNFWNKKLTSKWVFCSSFYWFPSSTLSTILRNPALKPGVCVRQCGCINNLTILFWPLTSQKYWIKLKITIGEFGGFNQTPPALFSQDEKKRCIQITKNVTTRCNFLTESAQKCICR